MKLYRYALGVRGIIEKESHREDDHYYFYIDDSGKEELVGKCFWFKTPKEAKISAIEEIQYMINHSLRQAKELQQLVEQLQKEEINENNISV